MSPQLCARGPDGEAVSPTPPEGLLAGVSVPNEGLLMQFKGRTSVRRFHAFLCLYMQNRADALWFLLSCLLLLLLSH